MRNLIVLLFVVLSFCITCDTTNAHWGLFGHQHQQVQYTHQPRVYYQPYVVWLPQGTSLNVGPVYVDPYRRNVRMGINYGFYNIPQVQTFNFYNGRTSVR